MTGAYAFGHVSGGHFNPAVTIGLAVAKRFDWKGVLPYIVTQIVAASVAGAVLFVIAVGKADATAADGVGGRLCHQRIRRSVARPLRPAGLPDHRGRADRGLRLHHPGRHRRSGAEGVRPDRHRPGPDDHPPGEHPGDEHRRSTRLVRWASPGSPAALPSPRSGCSSSPRSSAPSSPVPRTPPSPAPSGARSTKASPTIRKPDICDNARAPLGSGRLRVRGSEPFRPLCAQTALARYTRIARPELRRSRAEHAFPFATTTKSGTARSARCGASPRCGASQLHSAEGGTRTLTPEGTGT